MPGVLIADDSPEIRSIVRTFLESATSFKVCGEAGDATVAIESAQQLKPDVILLDLIMPELNGIQAASILRQLLPQSKIILFSFLAEIPGRLATAVGVDVVLSKSGGLDGIAEAIRSLTSSSSQPRT
jgi:DNA-binding NarL/FixJ family response regulator